MAKITLKKLQKNIEELLKKNPEYANLPIIYASDDEGNNYQAVGNDLTPMQVHDFKTRDLELIGAKGDEDVADEDINCICIN